MAHMARFRRPPPGRAAPANRRSPLANARWSLGALAGVAVAALWSGAGLDPVRVHGGGIFTLCTRAQQENCVIDGDTIRYAGLKIRLEDIDAPEVFSPQCAAEAARGRQATQRLLELINAGPFELRRTGPRDEDRYGRKLRTIARDGRSLGLVLVAEGLARPWDGARRSWCG